MGFLMRIQSAPPQPAAESLKAYNSYIISTIRVAKCNCGTMPPRLRSHGRNGEASLEGSWKAAENCFQAR